MANEKTKKERVGDVLSELDILDQEEPVFLLSNKAKEIDQRRQEEEEREENEPKYPTKFGMFESGPVSDEDWLASVSRMPKLNFRKNVKEDLFDGTGKRRKKRKKKDGTTDYRKEFDTEMSALKHLLLDQNEFVRSLQQTYNDMIKQKSSVRGIGKYQTDLIANITSARNTSASLIKEITNIKKTIADLSMKERKELGVMLGDANDLNAQASTFLKQLISADRKSYMGDGAITVEDADYDDMADFIGQSMESNDDYEERPEEVNRYLKYEGRNISIKVIYHRDDTYQFIAVDDEDNLIPDYPLPNENTKLSINRSTMKARDEYGVSYDMIMEE